MSEEMKAEEKQQDKSSAEIAIDRTRFFIDELARMEHQEARRYDHLSKRLAALEQKGKSTMSDDPEKMLGTFLLIIGLIQVLPYIVDIVRQCKPSESLPSL